MSEPLTIQFRTKNNKQVQAIEAWLDPTVEEILYGGGKGGGKSFLGASLIFGDALIYPETHYFIARKELVDLRKFTIPTIHEVFKNWGLPFEKYVTYNGQDSVFNLHNGSKVFLISCAEVPSDPLFERFGSMQMTRGWIEEGGEVPENAKSNLWLSVGRWKNDEYGLKKKLLVTANPKKGWMKRDFITPWKEGNLPENRRFIQALATDNPYLPKDYVESLRNEKDTVRRQRLFYGDWDYDEDKDSLVSYDALLDSFSTSIVKDNQKYMTVDVARFGEDSIVYGIWEGLELTKIEKREKQSIENTKQTTKDIATINGIPWSHIIADEDGVGGGLVDGMPGIMGFVANSRALPTATEIRAKLAKIDHALVPKQNFANLKAQCAFKLAELINERKIAFKVPDFRDVIIEELSALLRHKDVDSDGRLAILPKDKVKESLGHSPDVGDMIIFRAWFELKREATNEDPILERAISLRQRSQFSRNESLAELNSTK